MLTRKTLKDLHTAFQSVEKALLKRVMAEDVLYEKISKKGDLTSGGSQGETEPNSLLQKLKNKITKPVQIKVDSILLDVQKLSDYDKLYLYLQLPPGPSSPEKSNLDLGCVSTAEHMHACTWIRNHLEEHTDTCLPKQDVYNAYKRYCDNLCGRPLSVANFGKIIREIFPNIKARRLGGRGQSKYCYSGLRRKSMVSMPPLPSLDLKMTESSELTDLVQSYNNDVINAACALICNWAEKILKRSFNNVVEVAHFLIQQHIINPRSANAELVLSMVLSENSQSSNPKTQKQPTEGNKRPGTPEVGGTDAAAKNKKSNNLQPVSPQPVKKRPSEPQKTAGSPQVDALVARLPVLLPRLPSEKILSSSPPTIRFTPPILAPKIIPGSVKVSPLPFAAVPSSAPLAVTAGINGTGLVSQSVTPPVISMILPERVSLETQQIIKPSHNGTKECLLGARGAESKGSKRPVVSPSVGFGEAPSKRKRGRPRKLDNAPKNHTKPPSQGDLVVEKIQEGETKVAEIKDSAIADLQVAATEISTSLHSQTKEKLNVGGINVKSPNLSEPFRPLEQQEVPSVGDNLRVTVDAVPIQVSVIQDGRQRMAREGESEKRHKVPQEVPDTGPDKTVSTFGTKQSVQIL
ncbi:DNA-binding protein RFX5 [Bombina bombina]|uniref:DNA-binding protein RFX5 n=1 Tax=Bombina bombina TaxID=8345 RepID=UPI00235A5CAD|nr:DNA-binding protein RFX5 [Bombina bombina]